MEIDYTKLKKELVGELSLEGLSSEKQEEILSKTLEALLKRIFMDTMEKLGENGVAEYEKLIQTEANEEEMARFLEKNIPNYEAFVGKIVAEFKNDLHSVTVAA